MLILVLVAVLTGTCLTLPCTRKWTAQSSWTLQPERPLPPWAVGLSRSSKCCSKTKDSLANTTKLINVWKKVISVFFIRQPFGKFT